MSKIGKNPKPASRPPVDAVQYEKLALSAFGSCERQLTQLNRLATLATSIYRNPALTRQERRSGQVLLELLVETCEEYEREVECDRELYQVIALDARGIAHRRITARAAAKLLEEAREKIAQSHEHTESRKVAIHKATREQADVASAAPTH